MINQTKWQNFLSTLLDVGIKCNGRVLEEEKSRRRKTKTKKDFENVTEIGRFRGNGGGEK